VDDRHAHDIVIRALDAGAITTTQVSEVLQEWREASHPEFQPGTAWSLFNAVTEVHKRVNPHTACRRGEALYGPFDLETNVHTGGASMGGLVNRAALKRYLMEQAQVLRPALRMKGVSDGAVMGLEARLRHMADELIRRHPCMGKTITP
jgi:hypothetical protein